MQDGALHQISEAIGDLRGSVRSINNKIDDNRRVADHRHDQNTARFEAIEKILENLTADRKVAVFVIGALGAGFVWFVDHIGLSFLKKWL